MNSSPPGNATEPFHQLADIAQRYLDMLYDCDASMVDSVFHPRAQLCTREDEQWIFRSVENYKQVLRARTSPRSQGALREDQLLTLDLSSPDQAFIKIKMRINEMVFIDYLSMIRLDEGWRIVAKTYYRLPDGTRS